MGYVSGVEDIDSVVEDVRICDDFGFRIQVFGYFDLFWFYGDEFVDKYFCDE